MYLLDANTMIEAHRLYYAFDLVPGFWTWVESAHAGGHLASIQRVRDELVPASGTLDPLAVWAKGLPKSFWIQPDADTMASMGQIAAWANSPQQTYRADAISTLMGSADLYLVAECIAHGHTVVTREVSRPGSKKSVKIPDICLAFGAAYADPFSVYRALGMRL